MTIVSSMEQSSPIFAFQEIAPVALAMAQDILVPLYSKHSPRSAPMRRLLPSAMFKTRLAVGLG
jgi:hypothetical protein